MTNFEYGLCILLIIYIIWNEFDKGRIIKEMRKRYRGLAGGKKKHVGKKAQFNNQQYTQGRFYSDEYDIERGQEFKQIGQDSW